MKFRFPLKVIFITVSVLCFFLLLLSLEFRRAQRKLAVIEKLQENHGYVTLDYERDGADSNWRGLLGRTFLANVHDVVFCSDETLQGTADSLEEMRVELDGNAIALLAEFTHCKELYLSDTTVDNAELTRLDGLSELSVLALQRTSVDDSCIATLAKFKNLETLAIDQTNITGQGALKLRQLLPDTTIWHEIFLETPDSGITPD